MDTYSGTAHSSGKSLVRAIHTAVSGRARYHVVGLHHSKALKQYLEIQLGKDDGIQHVFANLLTGNILVYFNPVKGIAAIAHRIEHFVLQYKKNRHTSGIGNSTIAPALHHLSSSEQRSPKSPLVPNSSLASLIAQEFQAQRLEPWHLIEASNVISTLETSATDGLSQPLAKANLQKYGPNLLPETASRSRFSMFVEQFKSLPVALLSLAAGLSIATGGLADAGVIMGVVLINAVIGYTTESQSERIIVFESTALSTSALAAYGYAIKYYGISPRSSTIGFMSLTLAQLFHALSCRSNTRYLFSRHPLPPNRYLAIALAGSITLQLLSALIPGLRQLLRVVPLNLVDVAVITSSALVPLLVNEATKKP
jgi:magnesium-transporting ATPase (P-type)